MRLTNRLLMMSSAIWALVVLSGCGGGGIFPGMDVLLNPTDVTPPWLYFRVQDVVVRGNLAYIGTDGGLLIYDFSDRSNPEYLGSVKTDAAFAAIDVSGNYAYAGDEYGFLYIIDISYPQSPTIVNSLETPTYARDIDVYGGYAYVAGGNTGLLIVDVDPSGDAHLVKTLSAPDRNYYANSVAAKGNYAYLCAQEALAVIDISAPESARVVHVVETEGSAYEIAISGDYAYVAVSGYGLKIFDISEGRSAVEVGGVEMKYGTNTVDAADGYAYTISYDNILQVIDVDPPETAHVVGSIEIAGYQHGLMVEGDVAYVTAALSVGWTGESGNVILLTLDISDPEAPANIHELETLWQTGDVAIDRNYAFTLSNDGLRILDISPPESARIVRSFEIESGPISIEAMDGYVFLGTEENGLMIMDADPVETANFIGGLSTVYCEDMAIEGGYLYAVGEEGFFVVDITPPSSPQLIKEIDTGWGPYGVAVSQGYAYVTDQDEGLGVYDIDPPEEAHLIKIIEVNDWMDEICIHEGHAYIANDDSGLTIVDIEPLETASVVSRINIVGWVRDVAAEGDFAYTTSGDYGLQIFDISDPTSPRIANVFDTPGSAYAVEVSGDHAYVADDSCGLRIIKLW